jgi:hypothetical protein
MLRICLKNLPIKTFGVAKLSRPMLMCGSCEHLLDTLA